MGARRVVSGLAAFVVAVVGGPRWIAPADAADESIVVHVVAGSAERRGWCGDGGPAREACLNNPQGITVDRTGGLLIADQDSNRIRRISPDGRMSTVVGSGRKGFCGDGGPARAACLDFPRAVAVDPVTGDLFIADNGNLRVRRVGARTATITTVAGGGDCKHPVADPRPALGACLGSVAALAADGHGGVYIGELGQVRHVDAVGTIRTTAGGRTCSTAARYANQSLLGVLVFGPPQMQAIGDGGPAEAACLGTVTGLARTPRGDLLIVDMGLHRIREVDLSGRISTIAGNGMSGNTISPYEDCSAVFLCLGKPPCPAEGPALLVCLPDPNAVAVAAEGSVLIGGFSRREVPNVPAVDDLGYGSLWRLDPSGMLTLLAGDPYINCNHYSTQPFDGARGKLACLPGISALTLQRSRPVIVTGGTNQVSILTDD
jgi:hypothetical protein